MTPGTGAAGARRKTVSFPAGVKGSGGVGGKIDADVLIFGAQAHTPKDVPGKFPGESPWARQVAAAVVVPLDTQRAPPPRRATNEQMALDTDEDGTLDMASPRSRSGRFWKTEYEACSRTSTAEVRRLAKKEQLAKKFARVKDAEAARLEEELRIERARVGRLRGRLGEGDDDEEEKGNEGGDVCGVIEVESPGRLKERVRKAEEEVCALKEEKEALAMEMGRLQTKTHKALEEKEEECEGLRQENEKLRAEGSGQQNDTHAQLHESKPAPRRAQKPRESFDIWADVAGPEDESALPVANDSEHSPLKLRNANETAGAVEVIEKDTFNREKPLIQAPRTKEKTKEERLEEAKRRLREKKRGRGVGAV